MTTSDLIALGILLFCVVLVLTGTLKWLFRFFLGIILGLIILTLISLLTANPQFNELSQGVFKDGTVIPAVKRQVVVLGQSIRKHSKTSRDTGSRNQ